MARIRIAGKKDTLEDVVGVLGEVGVVHLIDANRGPGARAEGLTPCEETARTRARRDALRASLRQVEEAAALLRIDLEAPMGGPFRAEEVARLDVDLKVMRELAAERKEIQDELAVAERYRKLCQVFAPVLKSVDRLRHVTSLGVTLDARYRDQVLPPLRERLEELTDGAYQLLWRALDEETVGILLLFPSASSREVGALLSQENIQEIRLPKRYEALPLQEGLAAVGELLRDLPSKLEEVDRALARLREDYLQLLPAEHQRLQRALERTEVIRLFASTRYLFVIEGYAPHSSLPDLRSTLAEEFGDEVHVSTLPIPLEERDQVPIAFENPRFFRPFERLLSFLPPPRYGTLDPTPLLALSFPLFFGLILGDAGYGLLALGGAWAVRRRWGHTPLGRDLGFLLAMVAASSIFFGLVYGELFGDLGHRMGLRPLWEDRLRAAAALLIFTVSIGAAHVLLGFLIGAFQNLRARLVGKAAGNLATVVALLALLGLLGALAQVLPRGSWRLAAAILVAALALLVYLEGAVALVELISAVGNILSYARLMALGVASAALAVVANELGGAVGNVVIGVIVALVLHGLNLVLGLFSPTVHSLRLHLVEFLPRFYHYGGRAYRPFREGDAL